MEFQGKQIKTDEVVEVINKCIFDDRTKERNSGAYLAHVSLSWNAEDPNDYVGQEVTISLLYYSFGDGGHFNTYVHTGLNIEHWGDTMLIHNLSALINTCK